MARDRKRKHPNDRRPPKSVYGRTTVNGKSGRVTDVRTETDASGRVAVVKEVRHDLAVPHALKNRLRSLFVKANWHASEEGEHHLRSQVLVITFREPQNGIRGLPVTRAIERKLMKVGFTHVVISRTTDEECASIPSVDDGSTYDELGYRITWFKPRGGHRHEHEKGGESVHEIVDELSVIAWLAENGLESLFENPYLVRNRFLPIRDEERAEHDAIAAHLHTVFGHGHRPYADEAYVRTRLFRRFAWAFGSDEAHRAFAESMIGSRTINQIISGSLATARYFVSMTLGVAYGLYNLPGARYVSRVDVNAKTVAIEPIMVDQNGLEVMCVYHDFLSNLAFEQVEWSVFRSFTTGVGSAYQSRQLDSSLN